MTDRDVEYGSRRGERAGPHTPSGTPMQPSSSRPLARTGKRADPTEPEVPSAKRVREIKKQRSLLLVGSAIAVLLAIVLVLLYKTGQQVTTLPGASPSVSAPFAKPSRATLEPPAAPQLPKTSEPAPASVSAIGAAPSSSAFAPASPRPKASAPSKDIFRKPAF
jgi:hypothetical protein